MVRVEKALITARGEGLFDPQFYRLQNADVAREGAEPFDHYLRHGWREGRAPNALFDDGFYRSESGLLARTPVSPLAHFVAFGQSGGLCPVPGVDLKALSRNLPGLSVARMDPYHQLLAGAPAGQVSVLPEVDDLKTQLAALTPASGPPDIDVIIPVYLGRAETLNTILHVLTARTELSLNTIVVDDASPDEALARDLKDLDRRGLISLHCHKRNKGFVQSINLGTDLSQRDVIWLNADTEVYDGWADRLHAAACATPRVATVTPLTNNGTICSYPRTNADNPGELELPWRQLDAIAAQVNEGVRIQTPTAVGFCTYVRREAIRAIGTLDANAFGRGYGEENDFSQRARAAGWSNLIAGDVFVRHFGSTSFQGSRAQRVEAALRVLDARYPDYRDQIREFLAKDPVRPARAELDRARLAGLGGTPRVLMVSHSLGGGTQQHVEEEIQRLSGRGAAVYLLQGGSDGPMTARLSASHAGPTPAFDALALDGEELWDLITALKIDQVHLHHLIDFAPEAPQIFTRRLGQAGLPYDVMVHDYYAVCPRVNLVDTAGHYCGEPGLAGCQSCLKRRGSKVGRVDISGWRFGYDQLLTGARDVRVPDVDVARRMRRYFPNLPRITVRAHEAPPVANPPTRHPRRGGPVRVAVLGAIGPTKGFDAILGLARYVKWRNLPMDLTIIGHTWNDLAARSAGVRVTGAYVNDQVDQLIADADPDVIWISSVWPETYSYTLSIALRSGRGVAAFDIGAMGTRVRDAGRGTLIPLGDARDPQALYNALCGAAQADQELAAVG